MFLFIFILILYIKIIGYKGLNIMQDEQFAFVEIILERFFL